jgi:hypothetical protein
MGEGDHADREEDHGDAERAVTDLPPAGIAELTVSQRIPSSSAGANVVGAARFPEARDQALASPKRERPHDLEGATKAATNTRQSC